MPSPISTRRGRLTAAKLGRRSGAPFDAGQQVRSRGPHHRRAVPDDALALGAHRSNPPPPLALLTTPPPSRPSPRDACVQEINERDAWTPVGKYFFTRNMSAVCAFAGRFPRTRIRLRRRRRAHRLAVPWVEARQHRELGEESPAL